jgi:MFS family permease
MYKKRLVFAAACMGILLFGVVLITLGSIAPELKTKLALDDVGSGTLFAILPFGILGGSLIFGPFADRYGYRIILSVSCFLMFVGFEGIALSQTEWLLRICIFITGLGGGIVNGATNAVVSDISDSRAADISILGVFFAIGALGMPVILGFLEGSGFENILTGVSLFSLMTALLYLFISFPPPKQAQGIKLAHLRSMISDRVLLLIAFYLFFQSSYEGLVNNWTTSYLTGHVGFPVSRALFGLSVYVAGMAGMRLIMGTVLRNVATRHIITISFALMIAGALLINSDLGIIIVYLGLCMTGAGLASGFPVMLGYTGDRYAELSGTAFSFVLFVALCGNMLLNYCMGLASRTFGIGIFPFVILGVALSLIILFAIIYKKIKVKTT